MIRHLIKHKGNMNFEINSAYLCDVTTREEWSVFRGKESLTDEELIKVLKGEDRCFSIKSADHPEFDKLRNHLEDLGFIECQRNSWNGDQVVKAFSLNYGEFKVGDRFPCGCAMASHLKYIKKI